VTLDLPSPLDLYVEAETSGDLAALGTYFAADAVVHDEGATIVGLEAIRAWKAEARAKYQYQVEPLGVSEQGSLVKMPARLSGSFPGSPVEVVYSFEVADGKIVSLEID